MKILQFSRRKKAMISPYPTSASMTYQPTPLLSFEENFKIIICTWEFEFETSFILYPSPEYSTCLNQIQVLVVSFPLKIACPSQTFQEQKDNKTEQSNMRGCARCGRNTFPLPSPKTKKQKKTHKARAFPLCLLTKARKKKTTLPNLVKPKMQIRILVIWLNRTRLNCSFN